MKEISEFLKDYDLSDFKEKELNFFQIAGFPHYENVSSNILMYFLKNEDILKIFLECAGIEFDETLDFIDVSREESTENQKRIDILINTPKYIIGIENKIWAALYNPIDDYVKHLEDKAQREGKTGHLIVFSKNGVPKSDKYKSVLYKEFKEKVTPHFYELMASLGHRDFLLFSEYIKNIEFLEEGGVMNKEFVAMALKNDDNIKKIQQIMKYGEDARAELIEEGNKIKIAINERENIAAYVYKESHQIFAAPIFELDKIFKCDKYEIGLHININIKKEYRIRIWDKKGKNLGSDEGFINFMKTILPNFAKDYEYKNRFFDFNQTFSENEYDSLIDYVSEILRAFRKVVGLKGE
ncbi:MAG: PD-(D/E)XK nuclease family protein [Mycoplasmataceae bacterium]|jgi:hypothetical protein|nr:PD-(D/E)XK nuclease family protein [Mycoplasmataceae bacterium]